jgi:hypothetical protein
MKPKKLLRWAVLASLGTVVVACGGGVTNLGSGDDPGGESGSANMGTAGTKDPGTAGKGGSSTMGTAGKDPGMGGTGTDPGTETCMIDKDCPDFGAPCEPCADGSYACNKTYCLEGKCVHTRDQCATQCKTAMDCPVPDVACKDCGDKTVACPTTDCVMGQCQTNFGTCGGFKPCDGVPCGSPCKACGPDGMTCDAALTYCDAGGNCTAQVPMCNNPTKCETVMDCGSPPPDCKPCGDGKCAGFRCVDNQCEFGCAPDPSNECKVSEDCPITDSVCTQCPNIMQCAVPACIKNQCELVCPVE